jgi:predicted phosphohydrolase
VKPNFYSSKTASLVAHIYNPQKAEIKRSQPSKNPSHRGLMEWFTVQALSSNPSTTNNNNNYKRQICTRKQLSFRNITNRTEKRLIISHHTVLCNKELSAPCNTVVTRQRWLLSTLGVAGIQLIR